MRAKLKSATRVALMNIPNVFGQFENVKRFTN